MTSCVKGHVLSKGCFFFLSCITPNYIAQHTEKTGGHVVLMKGSLYKDVTEKRRRPNCFKCGSGMAKGMGHGPLHCSHCLVQGAWTPKSLDSFAAIKFTTRKVFLQCIRLSICFIIYLIIYAFFNQRPLDLFKREKGRK